jgi:eukaryotic-like serine/threonine-protein kinase
MSQRETIAEQLFGEALELPREQRSAFLDRACAGKPALRRMVEDLLDENDRLSGFLSAPVYGSAPATATATSPAVAVGTRLLERYLIVERLGAGGMGVVYRARDEKLEREVAIKMLQPGVLSGEEARSRFRREARALAKLNHAHIAAVHDVIEQDGADFIVMELVAGESLSAKLRGGPLPVKDATSIALQVAEALEEAHEQGVIHRDLKPANVMITPKGQVKVLDFGLAKLMGPTDATQTAESAVMGTPLYMSPEQAIGQKADVRSDLWSLGVTYYESLAGITPFKGTSSLAILRAITDAAPPPLHGIRADAPLLSEQIVERALEKDPELRYQHARDFATDLRRVIRDLEPVRSPGSAAASQPEAKSATGWKRITVLASGAILVVSAGIAYWLRPVIPAPHATGMTQLTHDDTTKVATNAAGGVAVGQRLLTDGPRLYYEVEGTSRAALMQVSTSGGESEEVRIPLNEHAVVDLRAATSELLTLGDPLNAAGDAGGVYHMTLPGGGLRRIGSFQASDASWSEDGGSIYWAGGPEISETRVDSGDTKRILTAQGRVPGKAMIDDFRVSPDRTRIRLTVVAIGSPNAALWEARSDGSDLRPMFSAGDGMENTCCGEWTNDGKYYVFQSDRGDNWNVWAIREKQHWWEKTDSKPVRLTLGPVSSQLPLPSLDGKRIFFVGTAHRAELVRYDVRKQDFASILPGISADQLAYSRDGSRVAYVAVPEGTLWQSKADGSDRRQVTFAPMEVQLPRWSPDGKKIAFMGHGPGKPWRIYLMAVGGDYPGQTTEGDVDGADPSWSPDGRSIAFNGVLQSEGQQPIRILNLSTRQMTVVPGSAGMLGARWSPDGKFLLAEGSVSGVGPVMLYTFATGSWATLVDGAAKASYPTWSHDGKCVYYYDSNFSVWRVCLADRKPQVVGKLGGAGNLYSGVFGNSFGVAPDDSILVTRDIGTDQIYGLDVELP